MKSSKRIFVAAWEYPPIMSGESVMCKKTLSHSRFDYDVCCGPIEARGDGHIRLFPAAGNKYLKWPFLVEKCFDELDQSEHYEVMMSRVMPPNGHFAGWLIKRKRSDLKWVVYFSDPIWNSPFLKFSLRKSKDHRPNWLLMKAFGLPAKWAVRQCDLLVFNNERLARYVLGKNYDRYRAKVVIAPYGHEGIRPRPAPDRRDGKLCLTHVGQLYGNRTLRELVEGVALLKKREPALYSRLIIRQVGFASDTELERVRRSDVADAFNLVGQVSYDESLEEMYWADWLLVIDPVFDRREKNLYIPGKIYDYLSTGRPILCIANEDSATGDLAHEAGLLMAGQTGEGVYAALRSILTGEETGARQLDGAQFSCENGVRRLDERMEELLH